MTISSKKELVKLIHSNSEELTERVKVSNYCDDIPK